MRTQILFSTLALALTSPAWAAHGGGGGGMSGANHGATVSQAAHDAHASGMPVGPSVREVARSNSQGPSHASANAISHVQNSPGNANNNSVLGNGTGGTKHTGKGKTKHSH